MDKQKLLVIDNDTAVRQFIATTARDMGFDVEESGSGTEGMELIKSGVRFDIVIADMRTSKVEGGEMLKVFMNCTPCPVIILVTTDNTGGAARESMMSVAFEYLTEPLDIDMLKNTIDAAAYQKKLLDKHQGKPIKIPRVLVIEDDKMCLDLIESTIKDMGYDVTTASNGAEGLKLFEQNYFEIVVSDIRMPEMDGVTVLSRMKELDPDVEIILVTAYPDTDTAVQTMKSGAYDFISKPFDPDTIKVAIQSGWEKKKFEHQKKELLRKLQWANKEAIFIERRLKDQTSKLKKLTVFTSHMGANLEFIDEVVNSIPDVTMNLLGPCIVRLWVRDSSMGRNEIRLLLQNGSEIKGDVDRLLAGEGVSGGVYQSGIALYDVSPADFPFEDTQWLLENKVASYNVIPLKDGGETMGVLGIFFTQNRILEDYEKELLLTLCVSSAITIKNSMLYEEIKKDAITDPLTELKNRRYINMRLEEEVRRAKRGDCYHFTVVMADVNNFKMINDTAGHGVGDVVLQQIGRAINDTVRATDIAARYGGDEFLIILPGTGCDGAEGLVKKIMKRVGEISRQGDPRLVEIPFEVSMSFGISCTHCAGLELLELLSKADYTLHDAKFNEGERFASYCRLHKEDSEKDAHTINALFEREFTNRIASSIASLIDHEDRKPRDHAKVVSRLAVKLGESLFLPKETLQRLRLGGMLYNIGKLGIPIEVLNKNGNLTDDERRIVEKHVKIGPRIISNVRNFEWLAPIIRAVHERWDGKGYPDGLRGEEIPIESRVIAVVDAYLAMRIDRPYRARLTDKEAIENIVKGSGMQFDPAVVEYFLKMQTRERSTCNGNS